MYVPLLFASNPSSSLVTAVFLCASAFHQLRLQSGSYAFERFNDQWCFFPVPQYYTYLFIVAGIELLVSNDLDNILFPVAMTVCARGSVLVIILPALCLLE